MAKKELRKPRRLIIAGDFFNFDTFSTYAQLMQIPGWTEERTAARTLLGEWLDVFDEIYMLMGNHERRLIRFTAGAFEENDILSLITTNERVKMSKHGYMTIDTDNGVYRVTHQKNYSVIPLRVADDLANKFQQHIITHHEHHIGMAKSRYGHYIIVNNGALVDANKLPYVMLEDSKSAAMELGFCLLKNGYIKMFGDDVFTNWNKYG